MRSILIIHIFIFFSSLASAQIFIDALMHEDLHIVIDHDLSKKWIEDSLINSTSTLNLSLKPKDITEFKSKWKNIVSQALASSDAKDVYILISSHGGPGIVMFKDVQIELQFLVNELAEQVNSSESRGVPRQIHLVYNACFSGSIFAVIDRIWKKFRLSSEISVVSAASPQAEAHSGILLSSLENAENQLHRARKESLSYCQSCTLFQKIGRLMAAARNSLSADIPMFWSSNRQAMNLTFDDFVTELRLYGNTHLRIGDEPQKVFSLLNGKRTNSLAQYFFQTSPQFFYSHVQEILNVEMLLDQGFGGGLLAEKLIELFPKSQNSNALTTISESAVGLIAGWILTNKEIQDRNKFYERLILNWSVDSSPHVIGAIRSIKIHQLIERKDLFQAAKEFNRLAEIPNGWRHSASPMHHFIDRAFESLISKLLSSDNLDLAIRSNWIREILLSDEGSMAFLKRLFSSRDVPSDVKNHFLFIRAFMMKGSSYDFPLAFDKTKAIKILAELQGAPNVMSQKVYETWVQRFKRELIFDGEIELANKYLGLDLPFRIGPRRGEIPYPAAHQCIKLF